MLITLIAVAAGLACTALGLLAGLVTAYLFAETLLKIYDKLENPGTDAPVGDLVYDWNASTTTGDGVVHVHMYDGAGSDAVLELTIDDAHNLGAELAAAQDDAPELEEAAVDA